MARSLAELRAEVEAAGLEWAERDTRQMLMDKLRDHHGAGSGPQIDPMKAKDLKRMIDWGSDDPYAKIRHMFTDQFVMEPKLDGCRVRMLFTEDGVAIQTGKRSVKTHAYIQREDNFPLLRDLDLPKLGGTMIDGEMLAPTAQMTTHTGNTTNSLLNATVSLVNSNPADAVATQEKYGWATFHAFDMLMDRGKNIMGLPYYERSRRLEKTFDYIRKHRPQAPLQLVQSMDSEEQSISSSFDMGYEGVMIKSVAGPYEPGKRSRYWHKIKIMSTFDAFVMGWVPGEGRNEGLVGGLKMGLMDEHGDPFEICRHGVFTDEFRAKLTNKHGELRRRWYGEVMELMAQGVTKEGRVRHPHLIRLRPDKLADSCGMDQLEALPRI